jgi:hypothetical protein
MTVDTILPDLQQTCHAKAENGHVRHLVFEKRKAADFPSPMTAMPMT